MGTERRLGRQISVVLAPLMIGGALVTGCQGELGEGSGQGGTTGVTTTIATTVAGSFGTEANTNGSGTTTAAECAAVSQEAMPIVRPADIIIAVDTSGSMNEEIVWVQDHMNDLSDIITQSGVDAHVVLVADTSICVPTPLGSGQCNGMDENLPIFRHVTETVSSTDAFRKYIETYPQWSAQLRPNAAKIFVVITDDNSDMGADEFSDTMIQLDPTLADFKLNGIFSFDPPSVCSYSAAEGTVYEELVATTMGVSGDLCLQDFGPVFTDIAANIVATSGIACNFAIPSAPMGESFDLTKVNVQYTIGGMAPVSVLNLPGGEAACTANGGWYYDDETDPSEIILCPATCDAVNDGGVDLGEVKLDVLFGCDTEVPQ